MHTGLSYKFIQGRVQYMIAKNVSSNELMILPYASMQLPVTKSGSCMVAIG
jgi:hypothetical protein